MPCWRWSQPSPRRRFLAPLSFPPVDRRRAKDEEARRRPRAPPPAPHALSLRAPSSTSHARSLPSPHPLAPIPSLPVTPPSPPNPRHKQYATTTRPPPPVSPLPSWPTVVKLQARRWRQKKRSRSTRSGVSLCSFSSALSRPPLLSDRRSSASEGRKSKADAPPPPLPSRSSSRPQPLTRAHSLRPIPIPPSPTPLSTNTLGRGQGRWVQMPCWRWSQPPPRRRFLAPLSFPPVDRRRAKDKEARRRPRAPPQPLTRAHP